MFVKLTWDIKFKIIALLFIFCIITAHIVNASAEVEKMQNFYKFVSENKLLPAEASKICKNKLDEDKLMKIVLFGAIGLFAAPLIAPMFAAAGLFGAAAVSSGLATLGGGALSAGGFGMM